MSGAGMAQESGLRGHRTEFVREAKNANNDPIPPTDPTFQAYSDAITSVEIGPGSNTEQQRGLSDVDPSNFFKAPEEPTLTVVYDLQKWFIDGTGDPLDAAYDGIARTAGNRLPNSHTFVDRQELAGIAEKNTVDGGNGSKDTRMFVVGIGGYIDSVEGTGDPGDQQPISIEIGYEFVQERIYQIDQPDADTALAVQSTDANDTTQSVIIESEDGAVTETVTLDGTTEQTTTASYPDIDAIYVTDGAGNPADHQGDIQVAVYDGAATQETLAVLDGANQYDDVEGDFGIPAIGAGSHAGVVGTSYEAFIGDTITQSGVGLAHDINSAGFSVSNNTERTPRSDSFGQRISEGIRDTEVTATILGETESHDKVMSALQTQTGDIVWTFDGGTLTFPSSQLDDPGSPTYEAEQNSMTLDNTFISQGVTIA